MSYDALFSPIKLRGLELKNRVVLPGMNTKMVRTMSARISPPTTRRAQPVAAV